MNLFGKLSLHSKVKDVEKYLQKFQSNSFKAKSALIFIEQLLEQAVSNEVSNGAWQGQASQ